MMLPRSAFVFVLLLGVAPQLSAQINVKAAIDSIEAKFERALAQRDRAALETIIATPFSWVHASDGRVDSRDAWLAAAAQGTALSGQRGVRIEHGPSLVTYGGPQPHTAVRIARIQLIDTLQNREIWTRQTQVFVKVDGSWRMASGLGALMYEGARVDTALLSRYVGTYDISGGRVLTMSWAEGGLFATFPNGSKSQIFLASPTEEVVRNTGLARLRFTLDRDGRPSTVASVRGETEVWRATRRAP